MQNSAARTKIDRNVPAARIHRIGVTSVRLIACSAVVPVVSVFFKAYALFHTSRTPTFRISCSLQHPVQKVFKLFLQSGQDVGIDIKLHLR